MLYHLLYSSEYRVSGAVLGLQRFLVLSTELDGRLWCGALFAWIEEAVKIHKVHVMMMIKKFKWLVSYTVGKSPYKGIIENEQNEQIRKVGLSETHASENREASTHNNWWKANYWNTYQQERTRRTWNDEVWEFFMGSVHTHTEPRRRIEDCSFLSRQSFLRQIFWGFRAHVVATTVCTTVVYTHTLLSHAHFSADSALIACFAHLHACHMHSWLKCHEKGVCCTCATSLHLVFSLLMIHLTLVVPWRSLRDHSRLRRHRVSHPHDLAVLSRPKAQDMRHSAYASRSLATWPSHMQTQISCQIQITLSQTQVLLIVKRSCTLLRTMKQWSRWSSKDEVRWWDTCPEHTVSR